MDDFEEYSELELILEAGADLEEMLQIAYDVADKEDKEGE